eukprot:COSAG01_NODE_59661_length_299_cov_0.760000_1_plen_26_part_01
MAGGKQQMKAMPITLGGAAARERWRR